MGSKNVLNYNLYGIGVYRNLKFDVDATFKTQMYTKKSFF